MGSIAGVDFIRINGRSFAYMDFELASDRALAKKFTGTSSPGQIVDAFGGCGLLCGGLCGDELRICDVVVAVDVTTRSLWVLDMREYPMFNDDGDGVLYQEEGPEEELEIELNEDKHAFL